MRIHIINLPYDKVIIRRYSCAYHAVGFLYPPVELLRVATIIREKTKNVSVTFTDAIAEKLNVREALEIIVKNKPDVVVTMVSIDYINHEYEQIRALKDATGLPFVVIGYLPDMFRKEYDLFDVILGNNFEYVIEECCEYGFSDAPSFLSGLKNHLSDFEKFNPDVINYFDQSFINPELYSDLFIKGKTTFTYFSFGCPYKCSFCISSYGFHKVYFRNPRMICDELDYYYSREYKTIRILDDNCTINKQLLRTIRDHLITKNIRFDFVGLTRLDLIDDEVIDLLSGIGFKRLYIGIETISEERQKAYNKNLLIHEPEIRKKVERLSKHKIEVGVFIIFDPVDETKEELKRTIRFVKKLPVYYADMTFITAYPGTDFFKKNAGNINFSPFPYRSTIIERGEINQNRLGLYFLLSFYLFNRLNFLHLLWRYVKFPKQTATILKILIEYIFHRKRDRNDFI